MRTRDDHRHRAPQSHRSSNRRLSSEWWHQALRFNEQALIDSAMIRIPCRFPEGPLLRDPTDLDVSELTSEEVIHVPNARVVVAEYDVLQHDFPELRTDNLIGLNPHLHGHDDAKRAEAVRAILDAWLIANAAFVSIAQVNHPVINSPVETDGRRTLAYRPPKYGRAVVVPTQDTKSVDLHGFRLPTCKGLLDLKGAGVAPDRIPSGRPQSSGLEYLGTALSDFLVKKAIDEIFARELPTVWTVPVYAVLDLGFDTFDRDNELGRGPAGLHVRRAHRRRVAEEIPAIEEKVTFDMERALRRYGVTSTTVDFQRSIVREHGRLLWQRGRRRPTPITDPGEVGLALSLLDDSDRFTFDFRDLQLAREVDWPPAQAQMVDFGAIRVLPTFDNPVLRHAWEGFLTSVIWPNDPDFRHADPDLQLSVETWSRYPLAMRCMEVAKDFRRGRLTSQDVRRTLEAPLLASLERWPRPVDAIHGSARP